MTIVGLNLPWNWRATAVVLSVLGTGVIGWIVVVGREAPIRMPCDVRCAKVVIGPQSCRHGRRQINSLGILSGRVQVGFVCLSPHQCWRLHFVY